MGIVRIEKDKEYKRLDSDSVIIHIKIARNAISRPRNIKIGYYTCICTKQNYIAREHILSKPVLDETPVASSPIRVFNTIRTSTIQSVLLIYMYNNLLFMQLIFNIKITIKTGSIF